MKAGILTFHYAHHYGAQLQAYALMKAVMKPGVDCEIINYVRKDTIEGSSLFRKGLTVRSVLSNANTLMNYSSLRRRYERFNSFVGGEMKLSGRFYASREELDSDRPEYDVYVCGSDQIWNPLIYGEKTFDPAFFADFAPGGRRIAYAPSFGISSIPEESRELLKKYLEKFDCLSVREKQGEKIIKEITGRDCVTVLDPTLLLTGGEWEDMSVAPDFSGPYILCYFITDARKYGAYVKALAEKHKMPVVSLCGSRRVVPQTRHTVLDAGPKEFLGLFRNAALVLTDSFHGTVFSVNFKKEFYCFEAPQKPEKAVNSRIHNILGKLGLLDSIIVCPSDTGIFAKRIGESTQHIDYVQVDSVLNREREQSERYLKESLFA